MEPVRLHLEHSSLANSDLGLFLGTASSLAAGGPLGLLLGYLVVSSACVAVMISLGELCTLLPVPGGQVTLSGRFVDPALSFAMGWNYYYSWVVTLPAELSAAAVLINCELIRVPGGISNQKIRFA